MAKQNSKNGIIIIMMMMMMMMIIITIIIIIVIINVSKEYIIKVKKRLIYKG